ncbi:kinesin motor domain protein [Trichuris suis]|nr:kinesin motor domain protein [Trichuris suis]
MDPVEVFCRIKPPLNPDDEVCVRAIDGCSLQFNVPSGRLNSDAIVSKEQEGAGERVASLDWIACLFRGCNESCMNGMVSAACICQSIRILFSPMALRLCLGEHRLNGKTISRFTCVFDEFSTQKMVFDRAAFELVEGLLQGKNGLLFTYGITGSGKTYTMTGTPDDIGVLPRCLDVIFNSINHCQANSYVFVPDKSNGFDVQTELAAALEKQRQLAVSQTLRTPVAKLRLQYEADSDWEQRPRLTETSRIRYINDDNAFAVFVSYIEVYNNYVYDLLDSQPDRLKAPFSKPLREDTSRNMYVSGAVEMEVKSTEEAFDIFARGQRLRRVAHTLLNTESSRSHSVFNIRVVQAPLDENGKEVLQDKSRVHVSQLSLVDLAGSERTRRTGHIGERIRETGCINNSLMVLRQCIEQLRENQRTGYDKLVPYRDSRLTHLFKNFFDGEGKVRMIVCLNPSAADYDENVHVMQFAEMTQEVEVPRSLPIPREGDGLTPGRRRAAALLKELTESFQFKPVLDGNLLEPFPPLNLACSSPSEAQSVFVQMKTHFESQMIRLREIKNGFAKIEPQVKDDLTKLLAGYKTMQEQLDITRAEMKSLEMSKRNTEAELQQARSLLRTTEYRLRRDARLRTNQEEEMKRREREMAARFRQKDEKLLAVKEIVDRGVPENSFLRPWRYGNTPLKAAAWFCILNNQICQTALS